MEHWEDKAAAESSEQRAESSARLLAADGGGLLAVDGGGRGGGIPPVHTHRDLGEAESRELGDKISTHKLGETEMQRDWRRQSKSGARDAQGEAKPRCTERRNKRVVFGVLLERKKQRKNTRPRLVLPPFRRKS
ncbi:hypothetical protein Syun_018389 [Stephania yunnanensis]|uniref:Uncharacterized protein n=1 Tax=Stephania yunnanensis TaxID=152371 RepID=A0AAP0NUZ5_9MAGN